MQDPLQEVQLQIRGRNYQSFVDDLSGTGEPKWNIVSWPDLENISKVVQKIETMLPLQAREFVGHNGAVPRSASRAKDLALASPPAVSLARTGMATRKCVVSSATICCTAGEDVAQAPASAAAVSPATRVDTAWQHPLTNARSLKNRCVRYIFDHWYCVAGRRGDRVHLYLNSLLWDHFDGLHNLLLNPLHNWKLRNFLNNNMRLHCCNDPFLMDLVCTWAAKIFKERK